MARLCQIRCQFVLVRVLLFGRVCYQPMKTHKSDSNIFHLDQFLFKFRFHDHLWQQGPEALFIRREIWTKMKSSSTCNICGRTFWNCHSKGHSKVHTGEKDHKCPFCPRTNLKIHIRTHTGERPNECNICQKRYTAKISLQSHIKTHTGEKPYKCQECDAAFIQKHQLDYHVKKSAYRRKTFSLYRMWGSIHKKRQLDYHMAKIHTGERFICGTCSKSFVTESNLKHHNMRAHSGEKHFRCCECGTAFTYKIQLEHQMKKIHWGDSRYHCDICDKIFIFNLDLRFHKMTHGDKEPKDVLNLHRNPPFHSQNQRICLNAQTVANHSRNWIGLRYTSEDTQERNHINVCCAMRDSEEWDVGRNMYKDICHALKLHHFMSQDFYVKTHVRRTLHCTPTSRDPKRKDW